MKFFSLSSCLLARKNFRMVSRHRSRGDQYPIRGRKKQPMKQHTRFRTFILCILITFSLMVWGGVTPAAAQSGGTPPILLVVNDSSSNKFGRYLGEIRSTMNRTPPAISAAFH